MGPAYRLSYSVPFQPARAQGTKIIDVHGDEYLDAYNNVASVGHNHPRVVDAVARQLRMINTNTRYLQRDIIEYAENLVSTHDSALETVMFTCTGSEANDLAARMARQATGGTGIIVTEYAYHGCTRDVASWSPSSGVGTILGPEVRTVPAPDTFRRTDHGLAEWFTAQVQRQIDDLRRHGVKVAALVADSLFSSDGIYPDSGVLGPAVKAVHQAGGLFISDEVQTGFGRTGAAMWGYQRSNVVPDIITMGKPMGNGMPIGGVVCRRPVVESFGDNVAYFNTFGGENAPVAAARAVLEVIRDENLIANAQDKGTQLLHGMRRIIADSGVQADVRGAGMYMGVEFVGDLETKTPDPQTASAFVNELRHRKVITSMAGQFGNVIKVRPPLVFDQSDVDRYLTEFEFVARTISTSRPANSAGGYLREDLRRFVKEELLGLIGDKNLV
ncbi:aspartate aminotransferase family protein [Mycobacterium sp. MS1601]|uniref:aspartate aminotransferase family protein n=1 Tax=Mycobacterium sp. MS1601 TaxID=1936029 RepID=UPI001F2C9500|nr:aspartate aminotransferase family protein [Mycobacterium sp. MS1601]